jgi:AAA domain, putative AbiEii toxin, Type IV TA system/AAA ATPase domain
MLTKLSISNFKRVESAVIDLGDNVVFVGPNNSGKTTALQALALWDAGWRRWVEKRRESKATERSGVTINRRDVAALPVPTAKLLWRNLHTHSSHTEDGAPKTDKVYITIAVEGTHLGRPWKCALEFYYGNEESFYCRPVRQSGAEDVLNSAADGPVPDETQAHKIVYLPPMSGLADHEYRKEVGEIMDLIGQGQTAQVLRNLCWRLFSQEDKAPWHVMKAQVARLFQIDLLDPEYNPERSTLNLSYREQSGTELDLVSSGRGCQQVMLLLAYMLAHPGAVLLLDEPDAHLEILRQRDVYALLTETAAAQGSQIIAASHSEIVLQEAGERDVVVAFVGAPHRIDTRSRRSQVRKALESIRLEQYYVAEQKGWVLYLEGSTDFAILRVLARRLGHPAAALLDDGAPVVYLGQNKPNDARENFYGLREAKPDLVGLALFDRIPGELRANDALREIMWRRREIENYLASRESLLAWAGAGLPADDLVYQIERARRTEVMQQCIAELEQSLRVARKGDPWSVDIKVTDEFLDPLFANFYERLGTPQRTFKRDYHQLAESVPLAQIDPEVREKLDAIAAVAAQARPVT